MRKFTYIVSNIADLSFLREFHWIFLKVSNQAITQMGKQKGTL